jgi:hypothetical protein
MLLPGNYDITAPVRLYDNMVLVGSGAKTILKKCKGFRSPFALDADYGELQITVADASGFKPGMGVAVYDEDQRSGWDLTTAKITGIKGNVIYIDDYLLRDYRADKKGIISNSCSVISAIDAENVRIANLTVDGSRESNDMIDGCRAGGTLTATASVGKLLNLSLCGIAKFTVVLTADYTREPDPPSPLWKGTTVMIMMVMDSLYAGA